MPPRPRKTPIRTCVVCRHAAAKKDLLRIVRTPSGSVEIDHTGKRSGRGAYVCSRSDCRSTIPARKALGRALGVPLPEDLFRT